MVPDSHKRGGISCLHNRISDIQLRRQRHKVGDAAQFGYDMRWSDGNDDRRGFVGLKDLLKAVNLGDDSDTVGEIAGGLVGLYYGYDAIPKGWIEALQDMAVQNGTVSVVDYIRCDIDDEE